MSPGYTSNSPSSSSSSSSSTPNITPSVPTVTPIFPASGAGAASSSSSSSDTPADATTTSLATKLGLGLGIPFVVVAVALLTACVYRRRRRLRYRQAPPFDFGAPDMAPVSAADFAPFHGDPQQQHQQQQAYRYGPPRNSLWSAWGAGGAGAGVGRSGGGPYDDTDSSLGYPGRRQWRQVPEQGTPPVAHGYEDIGSPYEDRGHDTYHQVQVPVVQVHQPQQGQGQDQDQDQEDQEPERLPKWRGSARVSRGLSVNEELAFFFGVQF
ncbi:hypothetical protein Daus18300_006147 [Diaporthe australafricana]|uniref:Transmembrane protein n=1 Tax=Diaporthe australafricana TaxID=127596 RepID=A0ABR3WW34_9PEZI